MKETFNYGGREEEEEEKEEEEEEKEEEGGPSRTADLTLIDLTHLLSTDN